MIPPEVEEQYNTFLEKARRWNKFRKFGRRRRDYQRRDNPSHPRRARSAGAPHRRPKFKFAPRRRYDYTMSKKNPLGKDGKPLKCSICESEEHLRAFCPKKERHFGAGGKPRPPSRVGSGPPSSSPFLVTPGAARGADGTTSTPLAGHLFWEHGRPGVIPPAAPSDAVSDDRKDSWKYFVQDVPRPAASLSSASTNPWQSSSGSAPEQQSVEVRSYLWDGGTGHQMALASGPKWGPSPFVPVKRTHDDEYQFPQSSPSSSAAAAAPLQDQEIVDEMRFGRAAHYTMNDDGNN